MRGTDGRRGPLAPVSQGMPGTGELADLPGLAPGTAAVCRLAAIRARLASYCSGVSRWAYHDHRLDAHMHAGS